MTYSTLTATALLALSVISAGISAQAEPPRLSAKTQVIKGPVFVPERAFKLKLGCVVQGTPVEFPNDVVVTNTSALTVKPGSVAELGLPFGQTAQVTLPELAPGQSFFVANALVNAAPAGTACTATAGL